MAANHDDNEEYEVEEVIDYRRKSGRDEYLIKWKNYPSSKNSWEPESHLNSILLEEAHKMKLRRVLEQLSDSFTTEEDRNIIDVSTFNAISSIDLRDITSTIQNRHILKKLKNNDIKFSDLYIVDEGDEESRRYDSLRSENNFIPYVAPSSSPSTGSRRRRRGQGNNRESYNASDNMGYLGYFIGLSRNLKKLHIGSLDNMDEEHIEPFWAGFQHNQSINSLRFGGLNLIPGNILDKLHPFFRYNGNLTKLDFAGALFRPKKLARALRECTYKGSLRYVRLDGNELNDRGLKKIINALMLHENIERLTVSENNMGREGCRALGHYLTFNSSKLKDLHLSFNQIDDEGLRFLVDGLTAVTIDNNDEIHNFALRQFCLTGNRFTPVGFGFLASLLAKPYCKLEQLWLYQMNIGDEGAKILADGLSKNSSLQKLWFNPDNCGIGSTGWERFSSLVCDRSTVNNSYLSNHTIQLIGKHYRQFSRFDSEIYRHLMHNLSINDGNLDKNHIARWKIMTLHRSMKMDPFFDWNLKFLPIVMTWFEKDGIAGWDHPTTWSLQLSNIFQFVRGMPFHFGSKSGLAVQAREEARSSRRKRKRGRCDSSASTKLLRREQKTNLAKEEREALIRGLSESVSSRNH